MPTARALLALSAALLASSSRAASFDELAAHAKRVEALEPFLARYVGRCTDPFEKASCERNVAAARREITGKTFTVRIADAAQLVRPSLEGDRFVLLVTPFVDGGGGHEEDEPVSSRSKARFRPARCRWSSRRRSGPAPSSSRSSSARRSPGS